MKRDALSPGRNPHVGSRNQRWPDDKALPLDLLYPERAARETRALRAIRPGGVREPSAADLGGQTTFAQKSRIGGPDGGRPLKGGIKVACNRVSA